MKRLTPERQRFLVISALLFWCSLLLAYRNHYTPSGLTIGLWWNLFLALVPLMASTAFVLASKSGSQVMAVLWFGVWLLFLPNAPYILTDLIHLKPRPDVPEWFMLAMLLSCAGTGTLMGYLSLFNVQAEIARKFGARAGWTLALSVCILSGFGIYVGRFLRWNSWDALTRPVKLFSAIARQFVDAGPHPHPVPVTLVFGIGLFLGYVALHVVAATARQN